jgi:hypothetical protein
MWRVGYRVRVSTMLVKRALWIIVFGRRIVGSICKQLVQLQGMYLGRLRM